MKLSWDDPGSRQYETGVQDVILFLYDEINNRYESGVPWNGITSISINSTGGETTPLYADNKKIAEMVSIEDIEASIAAYTYPDEFAACDGSVEPIKGLRVTMQRRKRFGLVFRTFIGDDIRDKRGSKIHFLYNCMASPTERHYETTNEDPNILEFEWNITTIPEIIDGYRPTAYINIDTRKIPKANIDLLEQILAGTSWTDPRLPAPEELFNILENHDDSWVAGVFPILDNSYYPDHEPYTEAVIGFYRKLDERRF